jgi:hypothetical protein
LSQQPYPKPVRFRGRGAGRSSVSYLALHPMGFSVPSRSRGTRWSLTPPFHPYPSEISNLRFQSGGLIFCGTVRRDASQRHRPRVSPNAFGVTRHRALWCSDFPPSRQVGTAVLRPSKIGLSLAEKNRKTRKGFEPVRTGKLGSGRAGPFFFSIIRYALGQKKLATTAHRRRARC